MNDRFTLDNSLHEILVQAGKEICLFFPDFLFQMIPEEYRDIPLRDWAESYTMPWGLPFPLKELLNDSNIIDHASELWDWVPLWEEGELTLDSNDTHAVGLMIPKTDLTGVRHIHFVYSEDEVLYGAKENFLRACQRYGVKYTVRERKGMIHCYAMLPYFREAKEDFDELAAILAR